MCSVSCFAEKFGTADLTEKKANLVDEAPIIPESGRFSDIESVFKAVSSGRPINVQRKGVEPWSARATARNVFASNNLPTLTDRSNGIWDRMRIIPFNVKFRGTDQQDQHLIDKLKEELPGILNWALRGLVKLHSLTSPQPTKTFPQCSEGAALLAKMRENSDREQTFLREETKAATSDTYLGALNLYGNYKSWAEQRGYRPVGYDKFRDALLRVYPNVEFKRKNIGFNRKDTVVYGIDWFTDRPESGTTETLTAPPVQYKQGDSSNEWEGQPELGF